MVLVYVLNESMLEVAATNTYLPTSLPTFLSIYVLFQMQIRVPSTQICNFTIISCLYGYLTINDMYFYFQPFYYIALAVAADIFSSSFSTQFFIFQRYHASPWDSSLYLIRKCCRDTIIFIPSIVGWVQQQWACLHYRQVTYRQFEKATVKTYVYMYVCRYSFVPYILCMYVQVSFKYKYMFV